MMYFNIPIFHLYPQVYVEYAVKNPMINLGEPIKNELFSTKLDSFIKSSPVFASY
jgi:hypothetical protein